MKRVRTLTVLLLSLVMLPRLDAQDDRVSFLVYGGMTIPTGAFGEKIGSGAEITRRFGFYVGEEAGMANWGPGIGVEMSNTIFSSNFSWILSAKCLINTTDNSAITAYFTGVLKDTVSVEFENGTWVNLPIFAGAKYSYPVSDDVDIYGMAQGGVNITQEASRKAMVDGVVVEETTFEFTPDFGFEVGIGVQFWKYLNIGVSYLNLGTPRYEGTRKLNEAYFPTIPRREMSIDGDARPISMVLIAVGLVL